MIKIRQYRQKKGISQSQLADMLGVRQSTVAMWESGINKPRTDKLMEIAKVLGCTVADLLAEPAESKKEGVV